MQHVAAVFRRLVERIFQCSIGAPGRDIAAGILDRLGVCHVGDAVIGEKIELLAVHHECGFDIGDAVMDRDIALRAKVIVDRRGESALRVPARGMHIHDVIIGESGAGAGDARLRRCVGISDAALLAGGIDRRPVLVQRHGVVDLVVSDKGAALHGRDKLAAKTVHDGAVGNMLKVVIDDFCVAAGRQRHGGGGIGHADVAKHIVADCCRAHAVRWRRIGGGLCRAACCHRRAVNMHESVAVDQRVVRAAAPHDACRADVLKPAVADGDRLGIGDFYRRRNLFKRIDCAALVGAEIRIQARGVVSVEAMPARPRPACGKVREILK